MFVFGIFSKSPIIEMDNIQSGMWVKSFDKIEKSPPLITIRSVSESSSIYPDAFVAADESNAFGLENIPSNRLLLYKYVTTLLTLFLSKIVAT